MGHFIKFLYYLQVLDYNVIMQNQQDYLIYSFILALLGFNLIIALSLSNRIIKP